MTFIDDKVLEVLEKLPSECAYIDYKEYPYIKGAKYELQQDQRFAADIYLNNNKPVNKVNVIFLKTVIITFFN